MIKVGSNYLRSYFINGTGRVRLVIKSADLEERGVFLSYTKLKTRNYRQFDFLKSQHLVTKL